MRRRLAALLAATLVAGVAAVIVPMSPVAAANVCAGETVGTVTPGLFSPLQAPLLTYNAGQLTVAWNNPHRVSSWSLGGGICTSGAFSASGTLQGYCGHSVGQGFDNQGHLIAWTSIGTLLVLTNEVAGLATAAVDPTIAGNSCLHGPRIHGVVDQLTSSSGALTIIASGAVVRRNCTTETLVTTLTTLPAPTGVLIPLPVPVTIPTLLTINNIHFFAPPVPHAHLSVHVCIGPKL